MHQFHVSECVLTLQQVECMELLRRLHASVSCSECVLTLQQEEGMELLRRLHASVSCNRVRTGPGKPGKSWNLIIWIPGLESHGILAQVLESHGISCWQICMQQSCLLFWSV